MSNIPDAVTPDAGAETGDLQTAAAWDAYVQAGGSGSPTVAAEANATVTATDAALTEAVGLLEASATDDVLSVSEDPLATPDELWGTNAVDDPNADVAALDQPEGDSDSPEYNRPDYEFLSNTMADMSHQTVESWSKWSK